VFDPWLFLQQLRTAENAEDAEKTPR
jgi:hypothetical protein